MDPTLIIALLSTIIGAPLIREAVASHFKRGETKVVDDKVIRSELYDRVARLEGALDTSRNQTDEYQRKLYELTIKYEVLKIQFATLEATLELYRRPTTNDSATTSSTASADTDRTTVTRTRTTHTSGDTSPSDGLGTDSQ